MNDIVEQKRLSILKVLQEVKTPISSQEISEKLNEMGLDISERTVRFHLQAMDEENLTQYINKQGRVLTEKGSAELVNARIVEKVGYLNAKIDRLTFVMDFDPYTKTGKVIINVSIININDFKKGHPLLTEVFRRGFAMGNLMTLFYPGHEIGDITVPEGHVGVGTVCSITLNGILLANGIPTYSRFGGLLEIKDKQPSRFIAIINYDGTTVDPLEMFIRSGMTDLSGIVQTGCGVIGAGYREVPLESRDRIIAINDILKQKGLDCILEIGMPGKSLRGIPVTEGRIGIIVSGGLNPVAILQEHGYHIHSSALSGFINFNRLFSFEKLSGIVSSNF